MPGTTESSFDTPDFLSVEIYTSKGVMVIILASRAKIIQGAGLRRVGAGALAALLT